MGTEREAFWCYGLTGNASGDLDAIDGAILQDKDIALYAPSPTGVISLYALDADKGGAESSPTLIQPDVNADNKMWRMLGVRAASIDLHGATASRLTNVNADGWLATVGLTEYVAGTTNQVNATTDGAGGLTLSLPQNIHSGATPEFEGVELRGSSRIYEDDTVGSAWYSSVWKNANISIQNSSKDAVATNTAWKSAMAKSTLSRSSGKYYFEMTIVNAADNNNRVGIGTDAVNTGSYLGSNAASWGYSGFNGVKSHGGSGTAYGDAYTTGDIIGCAVDMDAGKVWWSKNGTWQNNGDPGSGSNEAYTDADIASNNITPGASPYANGTNNRIHLVGGELTYTIPSGFSAWDTGAAAAIYFNFDTTSGSSSLGLRIATDGAFEYSGVASTWVDFASIATFALSSAATNDTLYYNGSNWVNTSKIKITPGSSPQLKVHGDVAAASVDHEFLIGTNRALAMPVDNTNIAIGSGAMRQATTAIENVTIGREAGATIDDTIQAVYVGYRAGRYSKNGSGNTAVGWVAHQGAVDGVGNATGNTAIGRGVMYVIDHGSSNVGVGYKAMFDATGADNNVAVGVEAMSNISIGQNNVGLGHSALLNNRTSSYNTAVGTNAIYGKSGQDPVGNIGVGPSVLYYAADACQYNIAMGWQAAMRNNAGEYNIAIGYQALHDGASTTSSADYQIAIGYQALANSIAQNENIAIGYQAGASLTTGTYNVAIGTSAHYDVTDSIGTTAIGFEAGYNDTSADYWFAAGYQAMKGSANLAQPHSIAIGYRALYVAQDGNAHNIALGYNSLTALTTGYNNVAIGRESGLTITDGHSNVFIGYQSGLNCTSGNESVAIGYQAGGAADFSDSVAVGYRAKAFTNGVAIGFNANLNSAMTSNGVAIGWQAGYGNGAVGKTSEGSVFIGRSCGFAIDDGDYNVGIGMECLSSADSHINIGIGYRAGYVVTGSHNCFLGYEAGLDVTTGAGNFAFSYQAMYENQSGNDNIAMGRYAMKGVAGNSHSNNIALGYESLLAVTTGSNNIMIGYQAGDSITTGSYNILFGYDIAEHSASADYYLNIGGVLKGFMDTGPIGFDQYIKNYDGAVAWDDLRVEASSAALAGASVPSYGAWEGNIQVLWFSNAADNEVMFTAQLPHNYKIGTNLFPHVHWIPEQDGGANEHVGWRLEYQWKDIGGRYEATTNNIPMYTSSAGDETAGGLEWNKHYLNPAASIDGSGISGVSSILVCRLYRDVSATLDIYAGDAGLLYVDFHYRVDGFGSDAENSKS